MTKKALDEKYSYQIDKNDIIHLFRGEDECQQYLTNPLVSAIFKIETLEKENAELKTFKEKCKFNVSDIFKEIETENNLTKAKDLLRELIDTPVFNQMGGESYENEWYTELVEEAEQFLKETEE